MFRTLREALMNALVHRDYQAGARVSVQVLNDRAVIIPSG